MRKFTGKIADRVGLPPGVLVYTGERVTEEARIDIIRYNGDSFEEKTAKSVDECLVLEKRTDVTWINVSGIHQVENLQNLGECFNIHPLILEDILSTDQRPKLEDLDDYLFILVKALDYDETSQGVILEQVCMGVGPNYVLSFQERETGLFRPIVERLKSGRGRLRRMGADYLAYAFLDMVVDHYFVVLEQLGERIEILEEELIGRPSTPSVQMVHRLRREMILFRKSVWPLREVIGTLGRQESPLVRESTVIYLRDVHDHTVQIIDTIETFRDMLTSMLDLYLSSMSNRLNAVMKVLTIIATIFMPLTFIAGIYGMNFRYMPELEWVWGYPAVLLVMLLIALTMLASFKAKKWL